MKHGRQAGNNIERALHLLLGTKQKDEEPKEPADETGRPARSAPGAEQACRQPHSSEPTSLAGSGSKQLAGKSASKACFLLEAASPAKPGFSLTRKVALLL
jgi:hypothetical protein